MTRRALGRGLEALIPGAAPAPPVPPPAVPGAVAPARPLASPAPAPDPATGPPREVPITSIRPNPYQPRTEFDPATISELAASIRESGVIQPLVVRPAGDGQYELIAGERRLLASREAGLTRVPVSVREATRREMLEMALVENLQREDLNPIDEADAYQRLALDFGLNQEEIAKRVGKSRTAVTNTLRLLGLSDDLRSMIASGRLSAGHARALLALPDEGSRRRVAREIVENGLSVRQVEAKAAGRKKAGRPAGRRRLHPNLEAWEHRLRERFATQVNLVGGVGRGRIELHYFNEEDLERVLELLGVDTQL